ncbi:cellulase family glycosylhydrolase [Ectopseudomonas mendocina]|uniref:Cellulase family glycosylhydrolase n=1 Tax=Ectopseudomonas mendocina TaxID=300 RepID=A0ABZ2RHC6_ECTME
MKARSRVLLFALLAIFLVLILSTLLGKQADAQIQVLKAPREVVWKDFLGVNTQFLWFSPERYQKQIDRLEALGLNWVRIDLHWDRLEVAEDDYRMGALDVLVKDLQKRDLNTLFYLVGSARFITTAPKSSPFQDQFPPQDPVVFAQRMAMLADRYPSVAAWQVWNEPNLIGFWRPEADPKGYAELLQASTIALRQVQPEKPVVAAGMAFFSEMPNGQTMFDELSKLGAQHLGTVAAYHPYTQLPEGNDPAKLDFIEKANFVNQALRNSGVPEIWSTEWGWSAYKGPKEAQDIIGVNGQADYVIRRLALMSALDYDRIFLFTLSDLDHRASVRDRDYGLLDLDANPKPVYLALQRFLKVTGPKLTPADPPVAEQLPQGTFSIGWTREDGRHIWLFWSAQGGEVTLPKLSKATLHDPLSGKVTELNGKTGLQVPVKSSLQMLVWE